MTRRATALSASDRVLDNARSVRVMWRRGKSLLAGAVVLSAFALYLASIVVKEAVEGHISTSRSWFASIVIAGLAVVAGWFAVRLWRRLAQRSRA